MTQRPFGQDLWPNAHLVKTYGPTPIWEIGPPLHSNIIFLTKVPRMSVNYRTMESTDHMHKAIKEGHPHDARQRAVLLPNLVG